ncbi:hypothetical protein ABN763_03835 [Spongiivirga sp. MCCC 1A20706]|uniref:tetratricopeptide repeat protein n=1 Tax=Spongiivirga sp. MCCC 1A20706 TaxID=3160963 RepID=UPI003977A8D0
MRQLFVIFAFLFQVNFCFAQMVPAPIESIEKIQNEIKAAATDSIRIVWYKKFIRKVTYNQIDSNVFNKNINALYQLTKKANDTPSMAYTKYHWGVYQYANNNFIDALNQWNEAKQLYSQIDDQTGLIYTLSFSGEAYTAIGDYESAATALFEGLEMVENTDNHIIHARILSKIGINYRDVKLNQQADQYLTKALAYAKIHDLKREIAFANINLGELKINLGLYQDGINLYTEALEYYQQTTNPYGLALAYQELSLAHMKTGDYELSHEMLEKSDITYKKINYNLEINRNRLILSELLYNEKKFQTSKDLAQKSLEIALQTKNFDNEIKALDLIYKNAYALNNVEEALNVHIKLGERKDELINLIAEKSIENKRLEYTISKNKELAILNEEATNNLEKTNENLKKTSDRLENTTRITVLISLVSVLFLVALLFLLKQGQTIKQNNKELHAQNSLIENQNKEITEIANELSASNGEISRINENLETIIKDRTMDLEEKNELLLKYSQMNSHDVRAPLARILGIIDLLKTSSLKKDEKDLMECLIQSANEMDDVVKEMNNILHRSKKLSKNSQTS